MHAAYMARLMDTRDASPAVVVVGCVGFADAKLALSIERKSLQLAEGTPDSTERQNGMSVLSKIPTIAKAITASVATFGSTFAVAYADQSVNVAEWITIAISTVAAGIAVFAVPNKDATGGGEGE